jgi:hypothetical protein
LREQEAYEIAEIIKPYLVNKELKVIIMGDLNSLSSYDSNQHEKANLINLFDRSDNPIFQRFKKKYLNKHNEINYKPIDILLDAGLKDSCIESCLDRIDKKEIDKSIKWTIDGEDDLSKCISIYLSISL